MREELRREMEQELERAKEFSFDVEALRVSQDESQPMVSFIKAHLYLEHVLNGCLTVALAKPSALEFQRLSAPIKIDLCIASSVLPEDFKPILYKLNRMRNDVAHDLSFTFGREKKQEFWNLIPEEVRSSVLQLAEVQHYDAGNVKLGAMLIAVILHVERQRQIYAQQQVHLKYSKLDLDDAMEEVMLAHPDLLTKVKESRGV